MTDVRRARVAVSGTFAIQGFVLAVMLAHLPQFKDRWGFADTRIALVVLLVTGFAGVGSVAAEVVARRVSSAAALRTGLVVLALGAVGVAVAPAAPLFLAAFGLYGIGLGAVDAGGNMQAVAVQHRARRSIMTSFHAVWSAASIAGALWVALSEHLRVPLGASVLVAAGAGVLVTVLAVPALVHDAPVVDVAVRVPWRPVVLLGGAMACFYVVDTATANWSAIYLQDTLGAASSTAALGLAAYQATGLLARLAGDHVVRRVGIVGPVRVAAVIGMVGLVVVLTAPGPVAAVIGFAITGAALPVVAPLCFSAAGVLAPGAVDAVVARVNVFTYVGTVFGGVSVGLVGAENLRIGFVVPLVAAAALLVLARAFRAPSHAVQEDSVVPAG